MKKLREDRRGLLDRRLAAAFLPAALLAAALAVSGASGASPAGQLLGLAKKAAPAPAAEPVSLEESARLLRAKLEDARAAFNRFQAEMGGTTNLPPGATAAEKVEYRAALQMLVQSVQTQVDNLAEIELIRQRKQEFADSVKIWTGFAEPPPYSILMVDDLRDQVRALEDQIRLDQDALAFVDKLDVNAEASLKISDGGLRRINEQLEQAKDRDQILRLEWQREYATARNRMALATQASLDLVRQKMEEEIGEHRLRLDFAQRQLAVAGNDVRFSQADLDKAIGRLNEESQALEAESLSAYAALESAKEALERAREEVRQAQQQAAVRGGSHAAELRRLQAAVDVRNVQAQTCTEVVSGLRQLLDGLSMEREMWLLRFAVFGSHDLADLKNVYHKVDRLAEFVCAAKKYFAEQVSLTASQVIEIQNALLNADGSPEEKQQSQERQDALQARALIYRRVLEGVEKRERMLARWREMLESNRKAMSFGDRIRDLYADAAGFVGRVWTFELFVVEDAITVDGQTIKGRRGVTVGKVTLAVLILVIGYWVSNLLSILLEKLAVRRFRIEANQAELIRRWTRVLLVTALLMFSLVMVKIPLTVFAFAGGALAIGIGFGTQNILKNFISGIIILFERPFRLGDVLDVEGRRGTVTGIGLRSSVVQFWDGVETLIPNSALLENNLTNWTYSHKMVRFAIPVGVAYGSDTQTVTRLLAGVAERHGLVQKEPKPQILFTDFADSNLMFELRFWVDVSKHNSAQISSDLRHMIVNAFAEQGLSMAFPQRDLHWDASRPIRVQMMAAGEKQPDAGRDGPCLPS